MKKRLFVLVDLVIAASMILSACGTTATNATQAPATIAAATQAPAPSGKILIRWSIGIDIGANPVQVPVENSVVDDFNKSQHKIYLVDEIISNASARDIISTEIAADVGPDIVGQVGWIGSNSFFGQWLDLAPYIKSTNYETSKFDSALAATYQTDQNALGFPFSVYPSAMFYNTGLFTKAGLKSPAIQIWRPGQDARWKHGTVGLDCCSQGCEAIDDRQGC